MTSFRTRTEALVGAAWYLLVVVALPVVVLLTLGLWHLWQQGSLLELMLWWLLLVALSYAVFLIWRTWRRHRALTVPPSVEPVAEDLPERLHPRQDWTAEDVRIWERLCQGVEQRLDQGAKWNNMQALALETLAETAAAYHSDGAESTWQFTLPESLLVLEETARRYRQVVNQYLPFAEKIKVASLISLYGNQDNIKRSFTWANRARRVLRLTNPLGALLGEFRDLVTDKVFAQVGDSAQLSLQRLLLQEVAQVGIDLYSGRLSVGMDELAHYRSQANRNAERERPMPAEPLRVVLFGQVSAGKSSLVNALLAHHSGATETEVDRLAVTSKNTVHSLQVDGLAPVQLIDTPGYGALEGSQQSLVDTLFTADVWLLVVQLNRPARQADCQLLSHLDQLYQAEPQRRKPPMVVALTHADEWLRSGASEQYSIDQILTSVSVQLGLSPETTVVPCKLVGSDEPGGLVGIDALASVFSALEEKAIQVQFNRRRLELAATKTGWRYRLGQAGKLGSLVGNKVQSSVGSTIRSKWRGKSNTPDSEND